MVESSLKGMLTENSPVKIRSGESQDWKEDTLYKVYESAIEVAVSGKGEDLFSIGDSIECRYNSEDFECLIEGWISKIEKGAPLKITIQVHKFKKNDKVVNSIMHDIFLGCIVNNDSENSKIFSTAKKICRNEIVFISTSPIENSKKLHIELMISRSINFKTSIEVFSEEKLVSGYKYTCRFINTDALNGRILENFLNDIESGEGNYNRQNSFWNKNSKINSQE